MSIDSSYVDIFIKNDKIFFATECVSPRTGLHYTGQLWVYLVNAFESNPP